MFVDEMIIILWIYLFLVVVINFHGNVWLDTYPQATPITVLCKQNKNLSV